MIKWNSGKKLQIFSLFQAWQEFFQKLYQSFCHAMTENIYDSEKRW